MTRIDAFAFSRSFSRCYGLARHGLTGLLTGIIRAYQYGVSPLLGTRCRFEPSCSCYAHQALARHGIRRGLCYSLRRLARCHPFGGSGYDPVPPIHPQT